MRIWRERGLALTLAESHIFVVAWEWVDRRGQRKWLFDYTTPVATPLDTLQDFFVEAAHETTYAFSGNKHFFYQIRSSSDRPKLSTTSSKISKFWFSQSFFIISGIFLAHLLWTAVCSNHLAIWTKASWVLCEFMNFQVASAGDRTTNPWITRLQFSTPTPRGLTEKILHAYVVTKILKGI